MATLTATPRLTQLCDKAISELNKAEKLLRAIRRGDRKAARKLDGMCRFATLEGDYLSIPLEDLFVEFEEMDADEVFGPRQ
ncbi:MAG: hypothetical protein ACYC3I_02700 [Gemmataceae bacterium]